MAGRKNKPGWVESLKPIPNPEGAADRAPVVSAPEGFRFLAGWDFQPAEQRAQWLGLISDAANPAVCAAASSLPWRELPESTRLALLELAADRRAPAPARSGPARDCYLIEVYPYAAAEPDSMTCYLTAGELGEIEDDLTELRDDTESIESFTITEAPDESTLQQVRAWVHAFREREDG